MDTRVTHASAYPKVLLVLSTDSLTSSLDSLVCRSHHNVSRSCSVISVSPDLSDHKSCKALSNRRTTFGLSNLCARDKVMASHNHAQSNTTVIHRCFLYHPCVRFAWAKGGCPAVMSLAKATFVCDLFHFVTEQWSLSLSTVLGFPRPLLPLLHTL